jgi:hypothetical protein
MIPVKFKKNNNLSIVLVPSPDANPSDPFPRFSRLQFLCRSENLSPIFFDVDLSDAKKEREALRLIVDLITKLEPQIWGLSPSRVEIPWLTRRAIELRIKLGALGHNPPPGRGTNYHKEFSDDVWNLMPYLGCVEALPKNPIETFGFIGFYTDHLEEQGGELEVPECIEGQMPEGFCKLVAALDLVASLAS